jgi:hypothetical protein
LTKSQGWSMVALSGVRRGRRVEHKVRFGSVRVVDANSIDGDLGRGTGSQLEGAVVRVHSSGNNVLESPCAPGGSVIGRVSVADASLSLSLSLSGPAGA